MSMWSIGEILGFDFETTGVDRFHDVPVSYALVTVVAGEVRTTVTGLVNPGREIPVGASQVHGISTERARAEGISLSDAVALVTDAIVSAGARGVPLVGMKLDYDLTMLDTQSRSLLGAGLAERGWSGPVLDAVVLDRHLDRFRKGSRTLGALCAHYGVEIENAHDAAADAIASIGVLLAQAACYKELRNADLISLHEAQISWHHDWAESYDGWRSEQGMAPIDPRDYMWPVATTVRSAA
jgi:DNA polymerase-3 subunit epsilon